MLDDPVWASPDVVPATSTRNAKAKIEKKRLQRFIALLRIKNVESNGYGQRCCGVDSPPPPDSPVPPPAAAGLPPRLQEDENMLLLVFADARSMGSTPASKVMAVPGAVPAP